MSSVRHAPGLDRVRANTGPPVNDRLDLEAQLRLRQAAASGTTDELTRRIRHAADEWDFDRVVETEAALMGLTGLALGVAVHKRLLALAGVVAAMLILHATHGWYPWLTVFRRMGVRTRDEIDRERYALKVMRGDFRTLPGSAAAERAAAAWKAVCQ